MNNERIETATKLGALAFNAGLHRAPAVDPSVMPLLRGLTAKEALPVLDAWLLGWDVTNIATKPLQVDALLMPLDEEQRFSHY